MTMTPHPRHPDRGERGATLIMAVVFVFVVAISLVAVGGLAANALLHTSNVRAQRTSNEDAATAVTTAMQYLRYNPAPPTTPWPPNPSTLLTCLPPGSTIPSSDYPRTSTTNAVQVTCTVTLASTDPTRVVEFFACPSGIASTSCTLGSSYLLLHADVAYNDLIQSTDSCYVPGDGSAAVTTSCGIGMTVETWDVIGADN
jgi:hypothetical protein